MFQITEIITKMSTGQLWLAQLPAERIDTAERAARTFSGPEFLMALLSGVVLAFAFQLLFTNLSVAAGISYLGRKGDDNDKDKDDDSDLGSTIRKVSNGVGIWTVISVSVAIFFASLLAVKLSLVSSPWLGAILGLVIWGTYFCLLVWVSSTTVGSLVGSVVNSATAGFQALLGTATAALGAKAASNQVVSTARDAAAAVRRELTAGFDPNTLRDNVEDYLSAIKPPDLDLQQIRTQFENLFNDPQLKEVVSSGGMANIDRQTFVDLVSSRSDLSKRDINRIVDQLEKAWKQVGSQLQQPADNLSTLVNYLKSANPSDLLSDQLSSRLDSVVNELKKRGQTQNPTMMNQAGTLALNSLMGIVLGRTDLSDLDAQTVINKLKEATDKVTTKVDQATTAVTEPVRPYSTIRADVENYLLNTPSWQMNHITVARDFRDVLYDPDADPGTIRREVEQLNRSYFAEKLASRGLFTQAKIKELADTMEAVRREILYVVSAAEEEEKAVQLRDKVEDYIRFTPKENLTSGLIEQNFKPILQDADISFEQLQNRLKQFERDTLRQILSTRQDLTPEETHSILLNLEHSRDLVLNESQELQEKANAQLVAMRQKLESYLRSTGKNELNPEGIKRDLQTLFNDPQAGMWALRARFSNFDRDTLVQLLAQRPDLSEDEANQIVDRIESNWNSVVYAPKAVADKAKEQYDKVTSAIADYLRSTGKNELNPEGIRRDLTKLLTDPKTGALSLRDRLSQVDRDTLVKLLSQRPDISETQANEIIDSVHDTIANLIRAPRRVAKRVQQQVRDFPTTLYDYLRNTGKDELNPEAIKRDLQLLLHDPSVGAQSLGERLSHFDRSTLVALLSQRPDISEQEANRIADQIFAVRDSIVMQIQKVQDRVKSVIDGILARIRDYLNSLDRPELNYEGIRRDVRKLFYDPQAGFDALRDRLSHFNRDTLVAIMSSREDISEADANRIIDQIEGARTNVLQRAESLQMEAQRRLEELKLQAQKSAEETRKAAESAAWWLFFTALASAVAGAGAGFLAVL